MPNLYWNSKEELVSKGRGGIFFLNEIHMTSLTDSRKIWEKHIAEAT